MRCRDARNRGHTRRPLSRDPDACIHPAGMSVRGKERAALTTVMQLSVPMPALVILPPENHSTNCVHAILGPTSITTRLRHEAGGRTGFEVSRRASVARPEDAERGQERPHLVVTTPLARCGTSNSATGAERSEASTTLNASAYNTRLSFEHPMRQGERLTPRPAVRGSVRDVQFENRLSNAAAHCRQGLDVDTVRHLFRR